MCSSTTTTNNQNQTNRSSAVSLKFYALVPVAVGNTYHGIGLINYEYGRNPFF